MLNIYRLKGEIFKKKDLCEISRKLREVCTGGFTDDECAKCNMQTIEWLLIDERGDSVDWEKLPVGTQVFVRDSKQDEWQKRAWGAYVPASNTKFFVAEKDTPPEEMSILAGWKFCAVSDEIAAQYKKNYNVEEIMSLLKGGR